MSSPLKALTRNQKERLVALAQARARRSRHGQDLDIVEKYRGDPIAFITEGLGQAKEESWHLWRTVLKAAYGRGDELTEEELIQFREVAGGRNPPRKRVKQLWLIVGRRGGKDSIASMIATEAAVYADEGIALRPGERAVVACFATDREQAEIIYNYTRAYFEKVPSLRARVLTKLDTLRPTPIVLNNDVELRVVTNNFRAPRGRPIAVAVFDEVAFWRSEDSAAPDVETYNAVYPAMADIPNSMLVGISSPYRESGILFEKHKQYFGKDDDEVLVILGGTRTFRPTYSQAIIDRELEEDPERAGAEYLAQWRKDLAAYVPRDVAEAAVVNGRIVLDPQLLVTYRAFCDPSGGSVDSMTLGIGHRDKSRGVLDCLLERRAPFVPEDVVAEFAATLKEYKVTSIEGDRYAGTWVKDAFARHGIRYVTTERVKSQIYLDFLPHLNSGRVDLLDNRRMINQLVNLERRSVRGGRSTIDHPKGAHDDLINSVAGVLVLCLDDKSQPIEIPDAAVQQARAQIRRPQYVNRFR